MPIHLGWGDMPTHIGTGDLLLRLALTLVAGVLIGMDRGEHGRPAGLRTTLLVGLAACISMIQVNLLMTVSGKAPDSFGVMDLMRLPLGILTGVGFIGAGAILRKDNRVTGVTTAATLWFITVVGLCFGGGELGLGLMATFLGAVILTVLRPFEKSCKQEREAGLTIIVGNNGPSEEELSKSVVAAGYQITTVAITYDAATALRELHYQVKWLSSPRNVQPPPLIAQLAARTSIFKVAWQP
jgi:putative Mg2+ transporter-C (MgtC) family protein